MLAQKEKLLAISGHQGNTLENKKDVGQAIGQKIAVYIYQICR